jgi:alpha-tubulin suppressor-like RCC1 family protein
LVVGIVASGPVSAAEGPTLSLGDQSGLERDAVNGSVFMPIYLSEPATEPVVVSYWTVDDTATAGADYLRWGTPTNPRTITIPTGATQTQVNVPVLADNETESDEMFSLVATATGGGVVLGDDTGTATIVDADDASVTNPAITVSNPTVIEGDTGQRRAQFLIHLSRVPASPVTVTYATTDGTATAGSDYVAKLPGTVVFAPGQISKTVDVLISSDTTPGTARSFTLDITVTGGSPVEELTMSGTATIVDDDAAPAEPCPPGTFNSTDGNEPCTPAPAGFFVDTAGALAATPCAPGSFQALTGQSSCELAPVGSYVDSAGATSATPCPEGTTTNAFGAASPEDCVPEPTEVLDIAGGGDHTCALIADGTARCWGWNSFGQLGNGTNTNSNVPVTVTGLSEAVAITAGQNYTCAVLADGTARCWGRNSFGQLGNATNTDSNVPVAVTGLSDAVAITAGFSHACAVLVDGTARCWGDNIYGQLGNGTNTSSNVPAVVSGLTDAANISASAGLSCAMLADGAARCWGRNSFGQLGNGTNTDSNVPVAVTGLSDAVAITAGFSHACAVLAGGTARCWGNNAEGRLGDGTFTSSNVPVAVSGLSGVTAVSAGPAHSCAVLTGGATRCWGYNEFGQLGNGTNTDSNVPVAVTGPIDAVAISAAGNNHVCAMLVNGTARCWGSNSRGQLGDDTFTSSNLPVAVVGIP